MTYGGVQFGTCFMSNTLLIKSKFLENLQVAAS